MAQTFSPRRRAGWSVRTLEMSRGYGGRPIGGCVCCVRVRRGPASMELYRYRYVVWTLLAVANSLRRGSRRGHLRWGPALARSPPAIPSLRTLNWTAPIRPKTAIQHPSQALNRALLIEIDRWKAPRRGLYAHKARRRCLLGAGGHSPRFKQNVGM